MSWRQTSWRVCLGGGRLCLSTVNLGLLLVALLQALVILSVLLVGTIRVPEIGADLVRGHFAREGLAITWEAASLDLTGRLLFAQVEVSDPSTGHPLFEAEQITADLDLTRLLRLAPMPVEAVYGAEVAVYLPPELSASGGTEADLVVSELRLERRFRGWRLHRGLLQIGAIKLAATGNLSSEPAPARAESVALRSLWRTSGRRLAPAFNALRQLPPVEGHVRLRHTLAGTLQLDATLLSEQLKLGDALTCHQVFARLPELDLNTREILGPITLRAGRAVFKMGEQAHRLTALEAHLTGPSAEIPGLWRLAQTLELHGRYELSPELRMAAHLEATLAELPRRIPWHARLATPDWSATVSSDWHFQTPRQTLDVALDGAPNELLAAPLWVGGKIGEWVQLGAHTRVTAQVDLAGRALEQVRFGARTVATQVREARFDEVRLTGWANRERLQVGPILAFDPGEQFGHGYYLQDWTDNAYRIIAAGSVRPRRLDSLIPQFYRELWTTIDPGENAAAGDVDVASRWGDPRSTHALVAVRAREVAYAGVPVDHLFLHLWQASGFVDLMDLRTVSTQSHLAGRIALTFPRPGAPGPRLRLLELAGEMPFSELSALVGEELRPVRENMTFAGPLHMQVKGSIIAPAEGPPAQDLKIAARTAEPWELRGIPLDALDTRFEVRPGEIEIGHFKALRETGSIELTGRIDTTATPSSAFTLSARDLPYGTFRELLAVVAPDPAADRRPAPPEDPDPTPVPGLVDLELDLRYGEDRWATLEGIGAIALRDAELGRIHLFGALSRLFSSLGVTLTTLRLDHLESRLELGAGRLRFPDLELIGPAVRIEAPGMISLPGGQLNFAAKLFFLDTENPSLRGLFGPLLRPLGHAFEIDGRGTLEDPTWSFRHNPLNLFRRADEAPAATAPGEIPPGSPAEEPPPDSFPLPNEF